MQMRRAEVGVIQATRVRPSGPCEMRWEDAVNGRMRLGGSRVRVAPVVSDFVKATHPPRCTTRHGVVAAPYWGD